MSEANEGRLERLFGQRRVNHLVWVANTPTSASAVCACGWAGRRYRFGLPNESEARSRENARAEAARHSALMQAEIPKFGEV